MDFNKYYLEQADGSNYPVFRGSYYQKGYGIGNAFRRFISWAIPLLKKHALPLAKSVGKEIIHNVTSIATDALDGKDIKESAKQKFTTSLEKLNQSGQGIKRKIIKKKHKKLKKKQKFHDIFENNDKIHSKFSRMHKV